MLHMCELFFINNSRHDWKRLMSETTPKLAVAPKI